MRRLGLDTADTTALELYASLNAHYTNETLFHDSDDVALIIHGKVVSFNRRDVEENLHATFEQRHCDGARQAIALTLVAKYAGTDAKRVTVTTDALKLANVDFDDAVIASDTANGEMPYVLCIGDIFSDVFIKLNESEAHISSDTDGKKWLSVPFGSKPPYDEAETVTSVGPSPNAAVSCARLGLRVGLMAWLGDDKVSKDSLAYLSQEKIDTVPMVLQKGAHSSVYYVLRYGADRTILVKNEAYTYSWKAPKTKPDWVYLSLLSPDSWTFHQQLSDYLDDNPTIRFAFQPGTFHFKWGAKKLQKLYKRTYIVVMNREEAVDVTGASYESLADLAAGLHALGPKVVVITDGPSGSYASYDGRLIQVPNYPDPAPPLDRTGAGDAFASTIVAALAMGHSIDDALTWAPINSMSVVQKLGAQAGLLHQSEIKKYIKSAPDMYRAKELKK
jgi:ribokinase